MFRAGGPPHETLQSTKHSDDWVLHVDLDQFLAAVEVLRRPELAGRPVIVGGDGDPPRPRQVVATASYEARAFGVRSGMPLQQALRRCPDGVFLPSDHPAYDAASAEVMATLRSFGWPVEVWGWDEAFIGPTSTTRRRWPPRSSSACSTTTRLSCAIGIGETRLQAKTATGFAKPGGIARLTGRRGSPTMGERPVDGDLGHRRPHRRPPRRARHPHRRGARPRRHAELARHFGPTIGPHLRILGLGGDDSPIVDEPWVAKSRSKEETFTRDVVGADAIAAAGAAPGRGRSPRRSSAPAGRITHVAVKVRTASFWTRTKIAKLPDGPTTDPDVVVARWPPGAVGRFEIRAPVRLLGVRVLLEPLGD